MTLSPSHRRRFVAGLAVAAAVGVGLTAVWLRFARVETAATLARREAIASVLMLTDLVERAGGEGDAVRAAVNAWQAQAPREGFARVVLLDGIRLEASTNPADQGEQAAPRRLVRAEKPIYDRGQRLRAAVAGNAAGEAEHPEIELSDLPGGALALSAPLERDGAVVGMVDVELPTRPAPRHLGDVLLALLWFAVPVAGCALLVRATPRRAAMAGTAFAALLVAVAGFGGHALRAVGSERRGANAAVSAHVRALAATERTLVGTLGARAEPAPQPGRWDADALRRPRGLLAQDGAVDAAAVEAAVRPTLREGLSALGGIALLSALLLAAIGFGGVSRAGAALVRHRQAYAYSLPALLGMLALVFFPFAYGIVLSFTDSNIYNTSAAISDLWIGLKNYASILGDFSVLRRAADGSLVFNYLNFYWTFFFTVVWTVTNVAIGVSVGLLLALTLNVKGLALRPIYRVIFILPWAMPNYITALTWKGMFHQQFGVVNHSLALVGIQPISWFDHPFTSYLTALATNGWLSFPFMMVVSLGALQSIPAELYEAARVDGATRWQQFTAITLPSLKPALVPAVILSVVWTFNMFNIIYLVTAGEPGGATEILVTQAYKYAFERYRYGYAAAYSTIIFLILLVYGTFQNRVTRATEGI